MAQRLDAEAEPILVQVLEIKRRVLGEDHPDTLADMGNLAGIYMASDRLEEALPLNVQMLENSKRVLGEEHPSTLGATTNLGFVYSMLGRFEEAAEMFETSLPIKRRVFGLEHPWTGYALEGLEEAYMELGRADDALPLQRELLGLQVAPADTLDASADVLNAAGRYLLNHKIESLRDPERARGFAERACALAEEEGLSQAWTMLDTLALAQNATGDTAGAIETQKRAISLMPEAADPSMIERLAFYEAALESE
jgi:tetratricopeptide (TPR) repeat protein